VKVENLHHLALLDREQLNTAESPMDSPKDSCKQAAEGALEFEGNPWPTRKGGGRLIGCVQVSKTMETNRNLFHKDRFNTVVTFLSRGQEGNGKR